MFLLNTVSKEDAIRIFANYCAQNSTPEDIFQFDGELPRARLKYCPLMVYYAKYTYTALVEITSENEIHTESRLGYNTSQYRDNIRNTDSGFFASMYEDYADTRYADTTVKQRFMDRTNGEDSFAVFASTGQIDTVDEKLWPSEGLDTSLLIDDAEEYSIRKDTLVSQAIDLCMETVDTSNAEPPYEKIEYTIRRDIERNLSNRYRKCNYEIKDIDYALLEESQTVNLLFFPYYEFSFTYNRIPYFVHIAAHSQAKDSVGLFGGAKDVIVGNLPSFEKVPGSIFSKISERKKRKEKKKEAKEQFLNVLSKGICFTA